MLDKTDLRILEALQNEGRMKNTTLSEHVSLSPTPCLNRVKKLEEAGIITGYKAIIDPAKVGLQIRALVLLKLANNRRKAVDEFALAIEKIPAITECFLATGNVDYVARIYARDLEDYETIIKDDISELPYLASMETLFLFSNLTSKPECLPLSKMQIR